MIKLHRSVTKRGNRWRARYQDPVARVWVSAGTFATKRAGDEAINAIERTMNEGRHVSPDLKGMTVDDFVEQKYWLLDGPKVAEGTLYHERSRYNLIVGPKWGRRRLTDIAPEEIERWVYDELPMVPKVRGTGCIGVEYQRLCFISLQKILKSAVARRCLSHSPVPADIRLPKRQAGVPRHLTAEEVDRLARIDEDYTDLIYTASYGGFRLGELLALRVNDVEDKGLVVNEQVTAPTGTVYLTSKLKTQRSQRTVPMPAYVIRRLTDRIDRLDLQPNDLLFTNTIGGPWDPNHFRKRVFYRLARKANLMPLKPHDLRHTAASAWFHEKMDMVTVAKYLGDTTKTAEDVYVHFFTDHSDDNMARMDARIAAVQDRPDNVVHFRSRIIR